MLAIFRAIHLPTYLKSYFNDRLEGRAGFYGHLLTVTSLGTGGQVDTTLPRGLDRA